jgi:hypothetical protein
MYLFRTGKAYFTDYFKMIDIELRDAAARCESSKMA